MKNFAIRSVIKLLVLFFIFLFFSSNAAAAGVLDKTFGTNGRSTVEIGDYADPKTTIIQPDGKIIIVGEVTISNSESDTFIVRLNPNGTPDSSFGNAGKVIVSLSPNYDFIRAVTLAPDGKIIVAGRRLNLSLATTDFLLARFTTNGNLDTSFGNNGIVIVNQGSTDSFYAVAVQPDGKIIAAGSTTDGTRSAVALRFNTNGTLDGSFANSGLFFYDLHPDAYDEKFLAVELLPNGRILLGGTAFHNLGTDILALLESSGTLAQDFGSGGIKLEFSDTAPGENFDLKVLPDGKFLAVSRLSLRRLLSNGANDPTFRSLYTHGGLDTTAAGTDFAVRSDGRIIVLNQRSGSFYTVAYDNNGREISRFRNSSPNSVFPAISIQNDNKFVIAAATGGTSFAVTRYVSINSPATRIADFDYDEKTDLAVSRLGSTVYVLRSLDNVVSYILNRTAGEGVRPIPEDFYSSDPSQFPLFCWRFSTQNAPAYFDSVTENGNRTTFQWGISSDIPVGGDYDGETFRGFGLFRKSTELAIFRPSTGTWWIFNRANNTASAIQWGISGDKPVPADYDYDGVTDIGIYRPSTGTWWIRRSSDGSALVVRFGISTDIPLTGDYDGDGKADFTVYRPSEGNWYHFLTTEGLRVVRFGLSTDVPVPGDYDGDGKHDQAVFRNGLWYLLQSTDGFKVIQWGNSNDSPVAVRYDQ